MLEVVLSKRNLLALLHKVEQPESCKSLVKYPDGQSVLVRVESDKEHYANRDVSPGPMTPDTEAFISDLEAALKIVRERN